MTAAVKASAGARLRTALAEEHPLQVVGAINAYVARMAGACGFKAIYLSGGGVAANSARRLASLGGAGPKPSK